MTCHSNFRLLIALSILIALISCSPSKQIGRSAREKITGSAALRNAHVGISIFEPATGKYWFNFQGDKYFVPASNTKIPTCYAAMKYLGDSITALKYSMIDGQMVIQGTGDPTFLNDEYKSQPIYEFLKHSNSPIKWDMSNWQDEPLGNGWSWNDYNEDYLANRSSLPLYGNLIKIRITPNNLLSMVPAYFNSMLKTSDRDPQNGFEVERPLGGNDLTIHKGSLRSKDIPFYADSQTILNLLNDTLKSEIQFYKGKTPNHYIKLHSQALDSLLKPMMHRSDNFFAEQSLLMVSNELLGVMNDARIIDTLLKTDYKDLPQKPRWADGSGLSRYNLFSPQDFVFILNKMQTDFGMNRIKNIFATGNTGTLTNLYKAENGYIFAKTGTLSGVVALSGFLYTKKNKLLIFSVLVNNHQSSASQVRKAAEQFIEGVRNRF